MGSGHAGDRIAPKESGLVPDFFLASPRRKPGPSFCRWRFFDRNNGGSWIPAFAGMTTLEDQRSTSSMLSIFNDRNCTNASNSSCGSPVPYASARWAESKPSSAASKLSQRVPS